MHMFIPLAASVDRAYEMMFSVGLGVHPGNDHFGRKPLLKINFLFIFQKRLVRSGCSLLIGTAFAKHYD